jgi:Na+-transporting NADH:ubiquinone oxidoreductase subunit B
LTDGISAATPLAAANAGASLPSYLKLLMGNISGSMGETSAILIILAAIYLLRTKTASWRIILSVLIGVLGLETILYLAGASRFPDPIYAVLSGGVLFGAVFMATDPISSPSNNKAKWVFGILVGITATVIREFSLFPEGTMFAILIVNSFVPLMDIIAKSLQTKAKNRRATA